MHGRTGLGLLLRQTPVGSLFDSQTAALPVDFFRVVIGLLSGCYFFGIYLETDDFSGPDGLIDHALVQDVFWFTRLGLFHPGINQSVLESVFLLATVFSFAVVLGWRTKFFAALLFVVAVSTYRWNFLVMYVEDGIMHLMLFWLLLLPVGRTLSISNMAQDWRGTWERWTLTRVPGPAVGCFLCNLALIYLVAGFWKWTSPMWREGTALYAVLQLPVSRAPDFWELDDLPLLRALNWSALIVEPLFPLALLLRRGHPLKWLLLAGLVGFHGSIVASMKIPLANLACLGGGFLIFREEIIQWLARDSCSERMPGPAVKLDLSGRIACAFVIVLSMAMLRNIPGRGARAPGSYDAAELAIDPRGRGGLTAIHKPVYGALWLAGLAQQYQLFDWIDRRNYRFRYEIIEQPGSLGERRIPSEDLFPKSNRSQLLQCYLHDLCWFQIPAERQAEVKRSLMLRLARRYCRQHSPRGSISVYSVVERITADHARQVERGPFVLFRFKWQAGQVVLEEAAADPLLRMQLVEGNPPGEPR